MRPVFGVLLLCLLGCDRGNLRSVLGDVEVATEPISFGQTLIGFPTHRPLALHNGSSRDRLMQLTVTAPFSGPQEVRVPGGSEVEVVLTFAPLLEGNAAGSVRIFDADHSVEVSLSGTGVPAPNCVASDPCRISRADPLTGACVETTATDGAVCVGADQCLEAGTCMQGLCRGNARNCSDADRCTDDSCSMTGGCLHTPTHCAAPSDPCKVAHCDPALGCVASDAQDGTACGPADCSTAKVCISGACKTLPVPDGASCGEATPCQGRGTCLQHSCAMPTATKLTEAWSYDFPTDDISFHGVSDAAQNLYWVECESSCPACAVPTQCSVVSYTREGVLRFKRAATGVLAAGRDLPHLLSGNNLLVATDSAVTAVSTTDGALQWTVSLATALQSPTDPADHFQVRSLVADGQGRAWVAVGRTSTLPFVPTAAADALLQLQTSTGAVLQKKFISTSITGLVVDENDDLFLGAEAPVGQSGSLLISLNSFGTERWRVTIASTAVPLGVFNGDVALFHGEVRSTRSGAASAPWITTWPIGNVLMSTAGRTGLSTSNVCGELADCVEDNLGIDATSWMPGSAAGRWSTSLGPDAGMGAVSSTVASSKGDLLVAAGLDSMNALVAIASDGARRFSCELPGSSPPLQSSFGSTAVLLDDRVALVEQIACPACKRGPAPKLRVFEVPGSKPAAHGWTGAWGNPSGSSRPLPLDPQRGT